VTPRKNGLPAGRHQEIGLELARMHDRLTELTAEIQNAYPKSSRTHRVADRTAGFLFDLRSELASRWFAENPGVTMDAYWPPAESRDHRPHVVAHMPFHDHDLWCCSTHAEGARLQ
jgi:hypothetical protein